MLPILTRVCLHGHETYWPITSPAEQYAHSPGAIFDFYMKIKYYIQQDKWRKVQFPTHDDAKFIQMILVARVNTQIAKFMGSTWGPPGSCRPQIGPMFEFKFVILTNIILPCFRFPRAVIRRQMDTLYHFLSNNLNIYHQRCQIAWNIAWKVSTQCPLLPHVCLAENAS